MDIVLKFENQGSDAWVRLYQIYKRKWGQPSNEKSKAHLLFLCRKSKCKNPAAALLKRDRGWNGNLVEGAVWPEVKVRQA